MFEHGRKILGEVRRIPVWMPAKIGALLAAPNQLVILGVEDIDNYSPNSRDICGGSRRAHPPKAAPPSPAESVIERLKAGLVLSRFECRNAGISIGRYLCPSILCELRINVLLNSIRP